MMEVGSPSLQNVSRGRHIEQMLSPEVRTPSVDTGLSLGIRAGNNKGASMSPQGTDLFPPVSHMPVPPPNTISGFATTLPGSLVRDEAPPMSSSGRVSGTETLTMSPLSTDDGNQTTSTSPADHGIPPSIPTAAYWMTPTIPQNELFKPSLPNVESTKEFDKGALQDAGSENVIIPPSAAPLHTEATRVDVDHHEVGMGTQPSYLRESQPSQADLNNMYSDGTQLVHGSQIVECDETQPAFAGETQPVNSDASFDSMVILQNNTLMATATPLKTAGQSVSHELLLGADGRPSQGSLNVPATIPSNDIPASYVTSVSTGERETHATEEGSDGKVSIMKVPALNEHPEVYPEETAGQLDRTEGKKEKDTITSEPRPVFLDKLVNRKSERDEGMSQDGVAEIGVKDDVNGNAKSVSEQDIQAIKGRKVVKKFGRKKFEGAVVDYDAENQWFKVVYEDGDEEDLDVLEVKEILLNTDASSNASTDKRKMSGPDGAVNGQQARKRGKGTPTKRGSAAGTQKTSQHVKSPPGSKTKGLKRKAKSNTSKACAPGSSVQSQPTRGAKRKRSSDAKVMPSSRLELDNVGGSSDDKENNQGRDAKMPRKSTAKQGRKGTMAKESSAGRKGTRQRSISKWPVVESEVETTEGAKEGDGVKRKGKHQNIDASKDQDTLVGKAVKKDFGGTLYSGVVAKFDKKTKYYRIEFEDGDQEDLELDELKAVLV